MNPVKRQTSLQDESEKYRAELSKYERDFKNAIFAFLTSGVMKYLVFETCSLKWGTIQVLNALKQLEQDYKDTHQVLNNYLFSENQMILDWKQFVNIANSSKGFPKLANLLVCDFSQITELRKGDEDVLNKITERLKLAASKKIIFVASQKGLFDKYLRSFEMRALMKINEFENEVTSMIYANVNEAFIESSLRGHVKDVHELIKSGVDVNIIRKVDGSTALHVAAEQGHKDLVVLLLKSGAKILPNGFGDTPLHLAARGGHADVVLVFLKNAIDVNINGSRGRTALHEAASHGHNEVVLALVENNVDVNIKTIEGWNALHYAISNSHINVIKTLLENDANIDAQEGTGWTGLHMAASKNDTEVAAILLDYGANINVKNVNDHTALHLAASDGHLEAVKFLVGRGADTTLRNKSGYTPFDLAVNNKNKNIIAVLKTKT